MRRGLLKYSLSSGKSHKKIFKFFFHTQIARDMLRVVLTLALRAQQSSSCSSGSDAKDTSTTTTKSTSIEKGPRGYLPYVVLSAYHPTSNELPSNLSTSHRQSLMSCRHLLPTTLFPALNSQSSQSIGTLEKHLSFIHDVHLTVSRSDEGSFKNMSHRLHSRVLISEEPKGQIRRLVVNSTLQKIVAENCKFGRTISLQVA